MEFFVWISEHGEARILIGFDCADVALFDLRDHPQIHRIADRVDFRFLAHKLAHSALAFGNDAVDRSLEFERLAKEFWGLHKAEHIAGFDTVVQVEVEFDESTFERARNLRRLVEVIAYTTRGF